MSDNDNIIYVFQNGMEISTKNTTNLATWDSLDLPIMCFVPWMFGFMSGMDVAVTVLCTVSWHLGKVVFFTGRFGIRSGKNQWLVQRDSYEKWKEHRFYLTSGCLGSGFCFKGLQGFFVWNVGTNVNQSAYQFSIHHGMLLLAMKSESPWRNQDFHKM